MILRWTISITVLSIFVDSSPSPAHQSATVPPDLLFQQTGKIPKEHQVSIILKKNDVKRFSLVSDKAGSPLSISVTPCSSPVAWLVHFAASSPAVAAKKTSFLKEFRSDDLDTFKTTSSQIGTYTIEIRALEDETKVQIFASEEPEPPHAARMAQKSKVRLQERQRRRKVTIKWDKSPIDPHITEYCLVVSTRRNYTSLCGASGDRYGPYGHGPAPVKGNISKMGSNGDRRNINDILISCVGSRTHHTVDNLEHGKRYYVSLFAVNKQNNLTFPYGSTLLLYDRKVKHSKLKDGRSENVNLKKLDGKAVFRFKAGKQTGETMAVSVMPCGGAVNVEVLLQGKIVAYRKDVYSYGQLIIPSVRQGQRYIINIIASNKEELRRTSGVEVLATTKKILPLPELPNQTVVKEFKSLRNCSSVTVGWMPSPDPKAIRYCVVARESKRREFEASVPNQCALETRLRKSADYNLMRCHNRKPTDDRNQLMTERITGLKPGKRYVVQVTVKKSGGRTLSYNLLTVETNSKCT